MPGLILLPYLVGPLIAALQTRYRALETSVRRMRYFIYIGQKRYIIFITFILRILVKY